MNRRTNHLILGLSTAAAAVAWAGDDLPTKFSNTGGIANTRHNLTQRTMSSGSTFMDGSRNDYGQVCVYCHTPHAANTQNWGASLPLWNREARIRTFQTYNELGTSSLTQTVTQPGPNSLSCMSCHDGQTAVDSIVNMPGTGGFSAAQRVGQSNALRDAFLDTWAKGGDGLGGKTRHAALNTANVAACLSCHSPDGLPNATDFTAFVIGTDLRDDHPVGIRFPEGNSDFATPTATKGNIRYFDLNGSGGLDSGDIRLYDSGDGFEVECASCHDPHGVKGAGITFNASFLRRSNEGSAVCLTCHIK